MSVSVEDMLSMFSTCHYLANRETTKTKICVMSEPDDTFSIYEDFERELDPYQEDNSYAFYRLLENVFRRKKKGVD